MDDQQSDDELGGPPEPRKRRKCLLNIINDKYYSLFKTEPCQKGGVKIQATCLLCPPKDNQPKIITGDSRTEANFTKHLKRLHKKEFAEYEDSKKNTPSPENPSSSKTYGGPPLTKQQRVDFLILKYIVKGMKPLSTVEDEDIKVLIEELSEDKLVNVMSRRTLTVCIANLYKSALSALKEKMSSVDYICLTADAWSGSCRSFLGVTAHWINANYVRESAVHACSRFMGSHTYDKIAKELNRIMNLFEIKDKVVLIVTDNGANFIKAFKEFSFDFNEGSLTDEFENPDLDIVTSVDLESILVQAEKNQQSDFPLPPHLRCSSHTLNLIAGKDVTKVTDKDLYHAVLGKCTKMWNLSGTPSNAEKIKNVAGINLKRPGVTRWNGIYDSLSRILRVEDHLDELMEELKVDSFTQREMDFLKEFVKISQPVAFALDLLQGEKKIFLGILLPTLIKLQQWLLSLKSESKLCKNFVEIYIAGIENGFSTSLTLDNNHPSHLVFASISHSYYKLRWLPEHLKESMKSKFIEECKRYSHVNKTNTRTEDKQTAESSNPLLDFSDAGEIFSSITSVENTEIECLNYLKDPNVNIYMLKNYRTVEKVFRRYNTGLPSSAPVERLFSYAGMILNKKRCALSDEMFETLVFLKYNWLHQNDVFKLLLN